MSDDKYETWKNATLGRVVLKKYNQKGELSDEMVAGHKVFHITPQERRINTEMAATAELDMFSNGQLTPVRLIDSEEDAKELASNPNLMSEDEMRDLFKAHWKTFEARVSEISNLPALNRMLELASNNEVDAKVRQLDAIKARIEDVNPTTHVEISHAGSVDERTGLKPVTPR